MVWSLDTVTVTLYYVVTMTVTMTECVYDTGTIILWYVVTMTEYVYYVCLHMCYRWIDWLIILFVLGNMLGTNTILTFINCFSWMAEILWRCVGRGVEWSHLIRASISLILLYNYFVEIVLSVGKFHQLATVTTFNCQLVKYINQERVKLAASWQRLQIGEVLCQLEQMLLCCYHMCSPLQYAVTICVDHYIMLLPYVLTITVCYYHMCSPLQYAVTICVDHYSMLLRYVFTITVCCYHMCWPLQYAVTICVDHYSMLLPYVFTITVCCYHMCSPLQYAVTICVHH